MPRGSKFRITGGMHKGRVLAAPPDRTVRPMQGFIREALFSILAERILKASVLDLFSGTGAIGLEALSRGASSCVFIEGHGSPFQILVKNIRSLGVENNSKAFKPRSLITDLDTIAFPTYEELDLDKYTKRSLSMLTTRGCINQCAFCHEHVYWGSKFRFMSPENVLEELRYHVENNKIRYFIFNDFLINGNMAQLESLCDLIIENKLDISWVSNALVREGMDRRGNAGTEVPSG